MERRLDNLHALGSPSATPLATWAARGVVTDEPEDRRWRFGDVAPEDDELVLRLARAAAEALLVIAETQPSEGELKDAGQDWFDPAQLLDGVPWSLTMRHTRWLLKIQRANPGLDDLDLLQRLARFAARGGAALPPVEKVLLFAPWRDAGGLLRRAAASGLIDEWTAALGLNDEWHDLVVGRGQTPAF